MAPGDVTGIAAWDNGPMLAPQDRRAAQVAVNAAQAAIELFLRTLPDLTPQDAEERAELHRLQKAYVRAVGRARAQAREDKGKSAAVAA